MYQQWATTQHGQVLHCFSTISSFFLHHWFINLDALKNCGVKSECTKIPVLFSHTVFIYQFFKSFLPDLLLIFDTFIGYFYVYNRKDVLAFILFLHVINIIGAKKCKNVHMIFSFVMLILSSEGNFLQFIPFTSSHYFIYSNQNLSI